MKSLYTTIALIFGLAGLIYSNSQAASSSDCFDNPGPAISFVEIQSLDLEQDPPSPLTVKGKLKLPTRFVWKDRCFAPTQGLPAVVILHGSSGVDFRGDFYARALNFAGIATLEIDMWEPRGVATALDRPLLPIFTYRDAFAALELLSTHADVDPNRIGILGFSWGGVISLASAEELYAQDFGGGLQFAAHAAHYPVCYGYNNSTGIPPLDPPDERGVQFLNTTEKPILIQIGTEDDYDNGPDKCFDLIDGLQDEDQAVAEVVVYEGASHAWDRLEVPLIVEDPFADQGSVFSTGVVPKVRVTPNPSLAIDSRRKVVRFFLKNL